jgi:hypothetical protein
VPTAVTNWPANGPAERRGDTAGFVRAGVRSAAAPRNLQASTLAGAMRSFLAIRSRTPAGVIPPRWQHQPRAGTPMYRGAQDRPCAYRGIVSIDMVLRGGLERAGSPLRRHLIERQSDAAIHPVIPSRTSCCFVVGRYHRGMSDIAVHIDRAPFSARHLLRAVIAGGACATGPRPSARTTCSRSRGSPPGYPSATISRSGWPGSGSAEMGERYPARGRSTGFARLSRLVAGAAWRRR